MVPPLFAGHDLAERGRKLCHFYPAVVAVADVSHEGYIGITLYPLLRLSTMSADNPEFRLEILYALQSGATRFKELWTRVERAGIIRTKMTLVRYLKALEEEGVIKKMRASHKNVFYEIMPGERSSWLLAAGPPWPLYGHHVEWIIKSMPNKAIALHVAIEYAFNSFMREEATYAPAKILGGRPRYRRFLVPKLIKSRYLKQDWSDSMVSWHSRHYRMFLKTLLNLFEKYPKHVQAYLCERPWLRESRRTQLDILRQVLEENVRTTERDQVLTEARESLVLNERLN